MELNIEYVDTDTLVPYARNAKEHTDEQVDQIIKSIREFGMNDPIAVWQGNQIIEGHGRLLACKKLKMEQVPIIRLDHLTDDQRRAYTLVHNKLTLNTGWNAELLSAELEDIDFDMDEFGFELKAEDLDLGLGGKDSDDYRYQIIIDCDTEDDMNTKMDAIEAIGIKAVRKIV